MLIAAIDGGKTKTSCVIFDDRGEILGFSTAGPSGLALSSETVRRNLWRALESCVSAAGVRLEDISLVVFGLADLDTKKYRTAAQELVNSLPIPTSTRVLVEHDMITAYYAVTYGEPGVAVISGTGSIAFGMNAKGKGARALGWGWIFDDEGSAFWIAREALASAARYYEGRGAKTDLMEAIMRKYDIDDLLDIIYVVQSELEGDPAKVAEIAEVVDEVASKGDEVAKDILVDAGVKLAEAAYCIAERLEMLEEPIVVGGVGGVFKSELVSNSFRNWLKPKLVRARIKDPIVGYRPAVGSVVLALKHLGFADVKEAARKVEDGLSRMS